MSAPQAIEIPPAFARHTAEAFGPAGAEWLRDLPSLVAHLAREWAIEVGPPFELSYNYVARARRADGTEAVLKLGAPDDESVRQIHALGFYQGQGACQLLAADEAHRAMLLEYLRPGETLVGVAEADDEAATRIGANLMRELWRPVPEGQSFKPLVEWFAQAFERHRREYGGPGPFPPALFERAEQLARELLDSTPSEVLLHGDFHHYNVLSAERAPWLAIDPKGMIGDPGYEIGPFLLNPVGLNPRPKTAQTLGRRLDVLAEELAYDRARLRDWGIAHAVLSACWSAEGGGRNWRPGIATAEVLLGM